MSADLFKIIQGEDRTIKVRVKTDEGACFDLTGFTIISAVFKNNAGGDITVTSALEIAVTSAIGGELTINLTDTNTSALKLGNQSFELVIDKPNDIRIVQFEKTLDVIRRL